MKRIITGSLTGKIFLNVNLPDLPLAEIKGTEITRLARESHINTVEEGARGRMKYYWLVRQRARNGIETGTDLWAIEQGNISITPLYTSRSLKPSHQILDSLSSGLLQELQN